MPRSKVHLKPLFWERSHSLLTMRNAMSSYGGPALNRRMHVSPCGELESGWMKNRGAFCGRERGKGVGETNQTDAQTLTRPCIRPSPPPPPP